MCYVNYWWSNWLQTEQLSHYSDWGIDFVTKELGFDSWQGYFSCLHSMQTCHPPSFPSVDTVGPYPGIKWLWDEIGHSLPSCCKAKIMWSQGWLPGKVDGSTRKAVWTTITNFRVYLFWKEKSSQCCTLLCTATKRHCV